jgi:PAS domain S-box-containing protein
MPQQTTIQTHPLRNLVLPQLSKATLLHNPLSWLAISTLASLFFLLFSPRPDCPQRIHYLIAGTVSGLLAAVVLLRQLTAPPTQGDLSTTHLSQLLLSCSLLPTAYVERGSGRLLQVNDGLCKLLGYSEKKLLNRTLNDILDWQSPPHHIKSSGALSCVHSWRGEIHLHLPQGNRRTALLSLHALSHDEYNNSYLYAQFLCMDSDPFYTLTGEPLQGFPADDPLPVLRVSAEGTILYANRASRPVLHAWMSDIGSRVPAPWQPLLENAYKSAQRCHLTIQSQNQVFSVTAIPAPEGHYLNLYGSDITNHIRFEKALKLSEEKYRSIVETSTEGIWIYEKNGTITFVNQRMCELLGVQMGVLIGKNIKEFIIENELGEPCNHLNEQAHKGIRERELRDCRNCRHWIFEATTPLYDGTGTLGMVTDITILKQTELLDKTLNRINMLLLSKRNSNAIMKVVVSEACKALGAETGTILVREEGCWVARFIYGLPQGMAGSSFTDDELPHIAQALRSRKPVAIEDAARDSRMCPQTVQSHNIRSTLVVPVVLDKTFTAVLCFNYHSLRTQFSHAQLEFAHKLASSLCLVLENARLFSKLNQELAERKRIEWELKIAHRKLRELVELQREKIEITQRSLSEETGQRLEAEKELTQRHQALEAVYAMATSFGTTLETSFDKMALSIAHILRLSFVCVNGFTNRFESHMTQFYKNKLLHQDECLIPCSRCERVREQTRVFQTSGDLSSFFDDNCCINCQSDHPIPRFSAYVSVPIMSGTGELMGTICCMDFSLRRFEDYEIHLIEIFARYIAHELSRVRLEQQLLQAQEMRLLGHLTSGVAHEVRNPLNAIMAIAEALQQEIGESTEFEPYLYHLGAQVTRLSRLMEDLLSLGRPITTEHMQDIKVTTLIEDTIESWRATPLATNIQLQTTYRLLEPCQIIGDLTKLQQVIINLLDNAAQHQHQGAVYLNAEPLGETRIKISITDSGPGIPFTNIERVFEPFFTTRKAGTGLGLSIVRHIVESHHGSVSLHNNHPKAGLTAELIFPLKITVPSKKNIPLPPPAQEHYSCTALLIH